jgi:lipid A disaccharide synthetase
MSSESTPGAALDRLENLFVDALVGEFGDATGDEGRWQIVTNAHAIAAIGLAAVLPALADEMDRRAERNRHMDWNRFCGWGDAASHLRSLCCPSG